MGFKMKGFNAGKNAGFPSVGEYISQPDGSTIWRPTLEEQKRRQREENKNWKAPKKDKTKWEKKTEKAIAKYEEAKRKNKPVPRSVLNYLNDSDPDWLSKQNYHTFSNLSDHHYRNHFDFDDHVRTDIFGNRMYDRKGGAKGNKNYKRYQKARNKGLSHEQALQKIGFEWDPTTMDSTKNRREFRELENQNSENPNLVINSNYKDPNAPIVSNEIFTDDQREKITTDMLNVKNKNNNEPVVTTTEPVVTTNEIVDNEVTTTGPGNNEVAEKTFDPKDTNEDGEVDIYEEKAAKRAAMFAKKTNPHKFDSQEWWDWKNASNVAKSNPKKSAFTVLNKYGKKWM